MKCQKTIDARSYSHQALEEIRISVVHWVVAGESPDAVVAELGMNHCTLTEHRARYASTTSMRAYLAQQVFNMLAFIQ